MKHRYNRVSQRVDTRDLHYNAARPIAIPNQVDLSGMCSPVEDQGNLGSCTGHAIVGALEYEENLQREQFIRLSRLFVYFNERLLEGDTDQDAGGELRDGIKMIAKYGACDETLWPYDEQKFALKPSLEAYTDAEQHKALAYQAVDQTLQATTHALAAGHPIVIGITVFESFESDAVAATGHVPMPNPNTEQCEGGHAVLAVGYDLSKKLYKVRNSWSAAWGQAGYFYLPFDYMLNPDLAEDFWVISKIS